MARRGFWVRTAAGVVNTTLTVFSRHTWRGTEHIPDTGGAILAANHISHADTLVVAQFVYNNGRVPRFLTKASVMNSPVVGYALRSAHQIPVERGTRDAVRALDAAVEAVRDGHIVVVYPEGTTTKDPEHWPMRARTGIARLAVATDAPVIPVAQWGAHRLYDPITHRVRPRPRTPVTVVAGPPMDLSAWRGMAHPGRSDLGALSDAVMLRIRDLLADIRGETPPEELYDWPPKRQNPSS